jgi:hypothetical protein
MRCGCRFADTCLQLILLKFSCCCHFLLLLLLLLLCMLCLPVILQLDQELRSLSSYLPQPLVEVYRGMGMTRDLYAWQVRAYNLL